MKCLLGRRCPGQCSALNSALSGTALSLTQRCPGQWKLKMQSLRISKIVSLFVTWLRRLFKITVLCKQFERLLIFLFRKIFLIFKYIGACVMRSPVRVCRFFLLSQYLVNIFKQVPILGQTFQWRPWKWKLCRACARPKLRLNTFVQFFIFIKTF